MSIKMHMPKLASVRGQTLLTDNKPYLFRQSPIASQMLEDMIVGGTVAWNQLCNSASVTIVSGHKYYMVKGGTKSIGNSNGTALTGLTSGTDIVTDLTQMFGSTIADYVYSLEQGHAGDGIAWLKSFGFFTEDYYPYDSGSLLSVKTSAHETVKGGITHTYPLSDIELRGIPKLTDGNIVYDGDTYASDGTVTRKYGIVDLGSLTWAYNTQYTMFMATLSDKKKATPNMITVGYTPTNTWFAESAWASLDRVFTYRGNDTSLRFKDSRYTDAGAFKTAVNGVYLVYELSDSTTETTTPFENPQIAGTTEEYVDERTVPMPVGHVTEYFDMVQMEKVQMHMPTHSPIKMHMPSV